MGSFSEIPSKDLDKDEIEAIWVITETISHYSKQILKGEEMPFADLREWLETLERMDELKREIDGEKDSF